VSIDLSHDVRLDSSPVSTSRLLEALGWLALAVLLVVSLPLFVRMPVTSDLAYYDTCARVVLRGGALERDLLFLPPPGMVWSLVLVRSLLGWSSEAVRLADLAVVSGIIWLLVRWLRKAGLSRVAQVWTALLLFAFYLSISEWCHGQPDTWMLLPALAALHLRQRQAVALAGRSLPARRRAGLSLLEGICWATACLIKPFVALPALLAWLAGVTLACRSGRGWSRWLVADAACLLAGGLLVGAAWQGWLLASGSWSTYWQNVRDFRGEYYSQAPDFSDRCVKLFVDLYPWGVVQVAALVVALASLTHLLTVAWKTETPLKASTLSTPLLAALYVGWLVQAHFIQTQYQYHIVPVVLLALPLLVGSFGSTEKPHRAWVILLGIVAFGVSSGGAFRPARLSLWGRCWTEGYSPELRDCLALNDWKQLAPDWRELEKVASFLREKQVGDGELTCYHDGAFHLYSELGITPAIRFLYPYTSRCMFPGKAEQIHQEMRDSRQRYIVTDMRWVALSPAQAVAERPGQPLAVPPDFPDWGVNCYPYSEPVVFRAGRYYVHEVRGMRHPVSTGRQTAGD
jgi:hypothetical protein